VSFRSFSPDAFVEGLVRSGDLTDRDAKRVLDAHSRTGSAVERIILELGLVNEEALFRAIAQHLDLGFAEAYDIDRALADQLGLSTDYLLRTELLPYAEDENGLLAVAVTDPRSVDRLSDLSFHLRREIVPRLTTPSAMRAALAPKADAVTSPSAVAEGDIDKLRALANDGPVIRMVNDIVAEAVAAGASDIHVEAQDHGARVRIRVDGQLRDFRQIPEADRPALISRLKVMAHLNISEKRRPQDGRAELSVRGRNIDIRLSSMPSQFGESVVMRLLDRNRLKLDWDTLGFPPSRVAELRALLSAPSGIFLIAGPTGSGKTTTLYTALDQINTTDRKIVTVEDPIEYSLPGIVQVQIEPEIDMTFARALRAILRQDPDVIMIGEIRDQETAEIAVRAALVGRLVLSTIHTNSSVASIARLLDLGIPPYLLAATLRGVLSQRLLRRVCHACQGAGCPTCSSSGLHGRIVASELLKIDQALAQAIGKGDQLEELMRVAQLSGFKTLIEEAANLADLGATTKEEIVRLSGNIDA
jgi:general secretion pathway protein E